MNASIALETRPAPPRPAPARAGLTGLRLPVAAIAVMLLLQFSMIFTRAINWDEFWFYAQIQQFRDGNFTLVLQTLQVQLFSWLLALPLSEIDRILAGRVVMFGCELVTLGCMVAIASRFASRTAALVAALAWIAAGYTLQHGASFRTDPMVTALGMGALAILARSKLRWPSILAFGLAAGTVPMISIKIALFAPIFAGLAWWRWSGSRLSAAFAARLVACVAASLATFALVFAWHSAAMSHSGEPSTNNVGGLLSSAVAWMFFIGIPPYWKMLLKSISLAPILYALALAAPFVIARSTRDRAEKIALFSLLFPLLIPFFYKNTAAYFYPYMLAPVSVAAALSVDAALQRYSVKTMVLAICAIGIAVFAIDNRSVINRQRELIEAAHSMFPRPVAYFDQDWMLARFDKKNDFLMPWGIEQYRQRGVASYRAAMASNVIPLVLANADALKAALNGRQGALLPADAAALRTNYLRYWGPIYVAGKTISPGSAQSREFLVPGTYRLTGAPLELDGRRIAPGTRVVIGRGVHQLRTLAGPATLWWNDVGPRPDKPWVKGPIYVGF